MRRGGTEHAPTPFSCTYRGILPARDPQMAQAHNSTPPTRRRTLDHVTSFPSTTFKARTQLHTGDRGSQGRSENDWEVLLRTRTLKPVDECESILTLMLCFTLNGMPITLSMGAAAAFFIGTDGATWEGRSPVSLVSCATPSGSILAHTSGSPVNVPVSGSHSTWMQRCTFVGSWIVLLLRCIRSPSAIVFGPEHLIILKNYVCFQKWYSSIENLLEIFTLHGVGAIVYYTVTQ